MAKPTSYDIPLLLQNHASALQEFKDAEAAEQEAERHKTSALKRLNDAQKAIDEAMAFVRGSAPLNYEWKRLEREKRAVPA